MLSGYLIGKKVNLLIGIEHKVISVPVKAHGKLAGVYHMVYCAIGYPVLAW